MPPVNPTYEQLRQAVANLSAKYSGVETVLRMIITPLGIGSSLWNFIVGGITMNFLHMNTDYTHADPQIGDSWWNGRTYEIQNLDNSSTSVGEEVRIPVHNHSGADIANGLAVYITGDEEDPEGLPSIALVDITQEVAQRTIGLTTVDILEDGAGAVTRIGTTKDIPLAGFVVDDNVYASADGVLSKTKPEYPKYAILIGSVIRKDAVGDNGDVLVDVKVIQREVPTPICLDTFSAIPSRNALQNIHGGLDEVVAGHDLAAADLVLTGATSIGIGKLVIVLNAGSDFTGEITVTGTEVNRDTGVETPAQTSVITVDALSTDDESTDVNGIVRHSLAGAYITDRWFTGDVTITSSDTVLTDIDVYQCSFEQFNDSRIVTIKSFDMNILCTDSTQAKISAYGYTVVVTGDKVDITPVAEYVNATFVTGKTYRVRRSGAGIEIDGRKDGLFLEMAFLGSPAKFADAGVKVWVDAIQ